MNEPLPVGQELQPLPANPQPTTDDDTPLRPRKRDYNYQSDSGAPNFESVLDQLDGVVQPDPAVRQWRARCPVHADTNPSLSLSITKEGQLLMHCHGLCDFEAVWRALGEPPLFGYPREQRRELSATRSPRPAERSESREPPTTPTVAEVAARLRQSPLLNAPDAAEDWVAQLVDAQAKVDTQVLEKVASDLGVDAGSLHQLHLGIVDIGLGYFAAIFPEFDSQGRIVGLLRRHADGRKQTFKGSHRGLCLDADSLESTAPLYCCEGPTDTAALLTMGLSAVGRPSASGGIEYLVELLATMPHEREIIILGENDKKPDGRWPGREAAMKAAGTLSERLGRTVKTMLPPDGAKDVRAWLQQRRESAASEVTQ